MPTTAIDDVRTIAVTVADQDSALAFYVDVLGFEKRLDASISPTMRWIEVAPPGARTSIALTAAETGATGDTDTGIRFSVPDAAGEHASMDAGSAWANSWPGRASRRCSPSTIPMATASTSSRTRREHHRRTEQVVQRDA